jgi:hypothetical protein
MHNEANVTFFPRSAFSSLLDNLEFRQASNSSLIVVLVCDALESIPKTLQDEEDSPQPSRDEGSGPSLARAATTAHVCDASDQKPITTRTPRSIQRAGNAAWPLLR